MDQPFELLGISPVVAVADLRAAADFYARHLGFELAFLSADETYGVLTLQGQALHLVRAADEAALAATARHCSFRLRVTGIDALWAAVLASAPPTRVRALRSEPWGGREFHLLDLDGALIQVAEEA